MDSRERESRGVGWGSATAPRGGTDWTGGGAETGLDVECSWCEGSSPPGDDGRPVGGGLVRAKTRSLSVQSWKKFSQVPVAQAVRKSY